MLGLPRTRIFGLLASLWLCHCSRAHAPDTTEPAQPSDAPDSIVGAASMVPDTDIVLVSLHREGDTWSTTSFSALTHRVGYDNQPTFSRDGLTIFFTSVRDGQADIYAHDRATGTQRQITRTASSEFSPTLRPDGDGLSLVHEQAPQQWLWRHDFAGTDQGPIIADLSPVGYHAWPDRDHVALFIVGDEPRPHQLVLVDLRDGSSRIIAENIGRCLAALPGQRGFSYVLPDPPSDEPSKGARLMVYDLERERSLEITRLPAGVEDYAWTPDASLVIGKGSQLWTWSSGKGWRSFADLATHGVANITRVALSGDGQWLAAVDHSIATP